MENTIKQLFKHLQRAKELDKKFIESGENKKEFEEQIISEFKEALKYCQKTWVKSSQTPIEVLAAKTESMDFKKPKISIIKKTSSVAHDVRIKTLRGDYVCRVIKEIEPYKTDENGEWGVNITSLRPWK